MKFQLVLFTLYMVYFLAKAKNYKKFNYCKITCWDDRRRYTHSVCQGCKTKGDRREIEDDVLEFRQVVLDLHNKYRDLVASGALAGETPALQGAKNMMVMNYDLELEFIVRCYLVNKVTKFNDRCRDTIKDEPVTQNLGGREIDDPSMFDVLEIFDSWFNESQNVKSLNPYRKHKAENATHFFTMMWARTSRVGCGRIVHPSGPDGWKFVIGCNYANFDGSTPLAPGSNVYQYGEACSNCPKGIECNQNFSSLCGKLLPAPAGSLLRLGAHSLITRWNQGFVFFSGVVMLLLTG